MADTSPQKLEGWLLKKGAKSFGGSAFKKRWFSLAANRLHYYQNKGDSTSLGFIDILTASAIIPSGVKRNCEFQIVTPNRIYTLQAATESAMNEWVNALNTYRRHALRKDDGDTSPRRASVSGEALPEKVEQAVSGAPAHSTVGAPRTQPRVPAQRIFGSRGNSAYVPQGGAGGIAAAAEDVISENQRLQLLLHQKDDTLAAKDAELKKIKETITSELRSLAVKQSLTQEELEKVKDELSMAHKMVQDLKKKEDEAAGGGSGGGSSEGGDVQALKKELEEKDKQIEEQRVRIEVLKTKLEQRIEEEATNMKERVKETMGRLRKEHEEQLKKARGESASSLEEELRQLRLKNQELEAKLMQK